VKRDAGVHDEPRPPLGEGRTGPRQDRALRSRAAIIEAAAEAFARNGYVATSLNSIIQQTGLTKGAFYFHFASKDELALAVFRTKQAELVDRLREVAAAQPNALLALRALLRTRAEMLTNDPSLGCFLRLASELGTRFGPDSEFAASYEVPLRAFSDLVRRGQEEGVFCASLDPRVAGEALVAALLGTDELSKVIAGGTDLVQRTERWMQVVTKALVPPCEGNSLTDESGH
jgi:AcrR family transcriptional regulator